MGTHASHNPPKGRPKADCAPLGGSEAPARASVGALKARLVALRAIRHKSGMDDADYRALLQRVAGVESSTKITRLEQANAVLDEFRRLGLSSAATSIKAANPPKGRPKADCAPLGGSEAPARASVGAVKPNEWGFVFRLSQTRRAYGQKIYRLAERVGALQGKPVASKAYIEGIATQMVGCTTRLEFCDEEILRKVVQALEVHLKRREQSGEWGSKPVVTPANVSAPVIPAKAGIPKLAVKTLDSRIRGNDAGMTGKRAGMTGEMASVGAVE